MTNGFAPSVTLEEFLRLLETKPASEFVRGEIIKKPMPQGEHSRLQSKLCAAINEVAESQKIAYAFPELRCSFGGYSIVPDISVFLWERIPLSFLGRIANRFEIHPDWVIEILSPDRKQTKVLENLLHCSQHGTKLGWLIDLEEESILVVFPEQRVKLFRKKTRLPILRPIELVLTVENVFNWLKMK
ncbi:MAG: Uma2 family endonuclease [Prochloraceae cyanobacterium]|nr:Uma2 family endonuclease [Prochloraceae cyanobacterium]